MTLSLMGFAVNYVTSRISLSPTDSLKGLDRVGGLSTQTNRQEALGKICILAFPKKKKTPGDGGLPGSG